MVTLTADRPGDLLAVRFATSPIWETVLAVRAHERGDAAQQRRPWPHAAALAELDLAPLVAVNPTGGYTPDFLTPPPTAPAPRFAGQLAAVRRTPLAQVEEELARCRAGLGDAAARAALDDLLADPAAARAMLAAAIERAWQALVAPSWPRVRALLSADVAYRSRLLAEGGLRAVVDRLDPRIRWRGASIEIETPFDAEVRLDARGVVLMPSASVWPNVTAITDPPWQPTVVYPARGIGRLWEDARPPAEALARLLGGTRAAILAALDAPTSTTALAARLDLSPSGASRHLTALRDARLLATTRHGHEVRYARTRLGAALLRAGRP